MNIPISRRVSVPGPLVHEEPERFVGLYIYHLYDWYKIEAVDELGLVLEDGSILQTSPDEGQLLGMGGHEAYVKGKNLELGMWVRPGPGLAPIRLVAKHLDGDWTASNGLKVRFAPEAIYKVE